MPSGALKNRRVVRIGLTGGFGSGKSTVLEMLRRKGARVIDADAIVHELLTSNTKVRQAIVRRFGAGVVGKDHYISRKALATRIFSNRAEKKALENILHPLVRARMWRFFKGVRRGVAVADIPLLFESGLARRFDVVIVVASSRSERLRRLKFRGFSRTEVNRRIKSQWPLSKKRRLADIVVDNSGSKAKTKKQIEVIWKTLTNHQRVARGKNGFTART